MLIYTDCQFVILFIHNPIWWLCIVYVCDILEPWGIQMLNMLRGTSWWIISVGVRNLLFQKQDACIQSTDCINTFQIFQNSKDYVGMNHLSFDMEVGDKFAARYLYFRVNRWFNCLCLCFYSYIPFVNISLLQIALKAAAAIMSSP